MDFLFEVPASMRAARRPEVIASRRRRPSVSARRQGQLRDGQRRQVHLQALLRELREAQAGSGKRGGLLLQRRRRLLPGTVPCSDAFTSGLFVDGRCAAQVGTSIFDRWEQVTLIDPEWCERGVPRCLHAIEATRVHQTRPGVVSISMLRPFGPRRGRRGVSERERSRRRREVARTDAVAAKASARCRMRVYTPRECTEAVS